MKAERLNLWLVCFGLAPCPLGAVEGGRWEDVDLFSAPSRHAHPAPPPYALRLPGAALALVPLLPSSHSLGRPSSGCPLEPTIINPPKSGRLPIKVLALFDRC
uniref:Uncharacterized protein n=1 Tax=uncultured marine virus TaxID=186617 RepID=A0A0F7L239_9VIRU|nr:hypothetical protein [uncultured marine virus]